MQILIEIPDKKDLEKKLFSLIDSLKEEGIRVVSLKDNKANSIDTLRKFKGLGKEIYKNINTDEYIKKLRDEWQ